MRKGYFIRFGIYITAVLLLAAYACDGGTGPGDGNGLLGYIYGIYDRYGNGCVQKLSASDGSYLAGFGGPDAGWDLYDIAINRDNGDVYIYYGMDVQRFSKDGDLIATFNDVTMNTIGTKLKCALTGDGAYLWIVDYKLEDSKDEIKKLRCFDAINGEHIIDGPLVDLPERGYDIHPGPGATVWVLGDFDEGGGIYRFDTDGNADTVIKDNGSGLWLFDVDETDHSLWAVCIDGTFANYSSSGEKLSSFNADIGSSFYGAGLRISEVTGDLLFKTTDSIKGFSADGKLKFEVKVDYVRDVCWAPNDASWFLYRHEALHTRVLENRSGDTGEITWEVESDTDYMYLEPSTK
jgi:hypothetical protein